MTVVLEAMYTCTQKKKKKKKKERDVVVETEREEEIRVSLRRMAFPDRCYVCVYVAKRKIEMALVQVVVVVWMREGSCCRRILGKHAEEMSTLKSCWQELPPLNLFTRIQPELCQNFTISSPLRQTTMER